ncbi:MAG: 2-oxo-4-hydroxy-4-carboxy-5-ureidoimidazoline decarboxylase [Rhizobiaceae bacterium]
MKQIPFCSLNDLTADDFVETLKDIFEHSPWVAERVTDLRPFKSIRMLQQAMEQAVVAAGVREQLDLINAHPDLAGKAALAGDLTESSTNEQSGAGLDTLSEEEHSKFHGLNDGYKTRFGFPFILAVKGHDKHSIMEAFERRLENNQDEEHTEALKQIAEIARFRLEALLTHDE